MKKRVFFIILFFCPYLIFANTIQPTLSNIHYGEHERQVFDLWLPPVKYKNQRFPLVISIHGGGFVMGSKDDIKKYPNVIKRYLDAGIAFASINYRFLNHTNLQTIMREDIAGFVQYIRYNYKKLKIRKRLICSMGYSAGGSSSLWLATHDDIADPDAKNPIRRESSRVLAIGHLNAQFSYDFLDWYKNFGKEDTDKFLGRQVYSRYGLNSVEDLSLEEGIKIREDLDNLENISEGDASVFLYNNYKELDGMADNDYFMHGPHHARLLAYKLRHTKIKHKIVIKAEGKAVDDVMVSIYFFFKTAIERALEIK